MPAVFCDRTVFDDRYVPTEWQHVPLHTASIASVINGGHADVGDAIEWLRTSEEATGLYAYDYADRKMVLGFSDEMTAFHFKMKFC